MITIKDDKFGVFKDLFEGELLDTDSIVILFTEKTTLKREYKLVNFERFTDWIQIELPEIKKGFYNIFIYACFDPDIIEDYVFLYSEQIDV